MNLWCIPHNTHMEIRKFKRSILMVVREQSVHARTYLQCTSAVKNFIRLTRAASKLFIQVYNLQRIWSKITNKWANINMVHVCVCVCAWCTGYSFRSCVYVPVIFHIGICIQCTTRPLSTRMCHYHCVNIVVVYLILCFLLYGIFFTLIFLLLFFCSK